MQGGVSGFQNAPVTRAVVVASGLLSVVFSAQRRARALGISYQVLDLLRNWEYWLFIIEGYRCGGVLVGQHDLCL
uniref:Uncharacterized protein n=1 Tax=Zea mays TaxID=4577 RepID=B6UA10_MAIZE|nr:hypothetical protein [Zea mays]